MQSFFLLALWISVVVVLLSVSTDSYEYCSGTREREVCKGVCQKTPCRHTVCYPEVIPMNGTWIADYPMTPKLRREILHMQNHRRNLIASGGTTNGDLGEYYPAATRMRELVWDEELEYIALMHARRCNMAHDKCRSTLRAPYAGQNLGFVGSLKFKKYKDVINFIDEGWWLERTYVPNTHELIKKFYSDKRIGHFTLLVNDQASHVGCAMTYCLGCRPKKRNITYQCFFLSCDYNMQNVPIRIYEMSKTNDSASHCSDWKTGPSKKYEHLCANSGEYFDTKFYFKGVYY